MADVFVSYKKEDRAHAERFVQHLAGAGFTAWWDDDIKPRLAWDATIEKEITDAKCVVVLWSPLSIQSDWVRTEAHYGQDHKKLVPVLISPCTLPLAFSLTQTVDLCGWDGAGENRQWRKLLTWIADLIAHADTGGGVAPGPNPFRPPIGQMASGEPIVDGAFVNAATPAGTLFRDDIKAPVMRILPKGEFLLGGGANDPDRSSVETPQRRVIISNAFAIGVNPLSNAEFDCFGTRPKRVVVAATTKSWLGIFGSAAAPVEDALVLQPEAAATDLSFDEAMNFTTKLSASIGVNYRLPSEAEWEYACRGGARSRFSWGDDIDPAKALYRWPGSDHKGPAVSGGFAPNGFGLHDMHGNVREWTEDVWHEGHDLNPGDGRPVVDGQSSMRVTRGGGWCDPPSMLRCSARGRATQTIRSNTVGLRVVRVL